MPKKARSSPTTVFISHSHADRHTAVELQTILDEHGAQTFLDQAEIDTLEDLPGCLPGLRPGAGERSLDFVAPEILA